MKFFTEYKTPKPEPLTLYQISNSPITKKALMFFHLRDFYFLVF